MTNKDTLFNYDRQDWPYLFIIFFLVLALFFPGFFPNRIMLPHRDDFAVDSNLAYNLSPAQVSMSDTNVMYQPWNDYACERIKNLNIPFWNPFNLCGAPFFANSLNQLTYIPRLIISLIFPSEHVITILAFLHMLLAGFGFYYLLKNYNVSHISSFLASFFILFKFSIPSVTMIPAISLTLAFLPLMLLLIVKIIRSPSPVYTLILAVCLSCVASSGYPVYLVHFLYFSFFLAAYEYFTSASNKRKTAKYGLILLALSYFLAFIFSLTQILPLLQTYISSTRISWPIHELKNYHVNPFTIIYLLYTNTVPFLNNIFDIPSAPDKGYPLYMTVIPVIFFLPLFGQLKNKLYRFYFLSAIVIGLICFTTIFGKIAFRWLPGFGFTHIPPMPLLFICIIICFSLSFDEILKFKRPIHKFGYVSYIIIAFILIICAIAVCLYKKQNINQIYNLLIYIMTIIMLFSSLIIAGKIKSKILLIIMLAFLTTVNCIPLMKYNVRFFARGESALLKIKEETKHCNRGASDSRYYTESKSMMMASNMNIYPRLRLVQGYDPMVLRWFAEGYGKYHEKGILKGRRLVVGERRPEEGYLAAAGVGKIISNPDDGENGSWEKTNGVDLYVIDIGSSECIAENGKCMLKRVSPENIEINIEEPVTGNIRIAETYYSAWRYKIDEGKEKYKPVRDEHGFMLIQDIKPGAKKIVLYYDTHLEKTGFVISMLSFIAATIIIIMIERKKRRRNTSAI